VTFMRCLSLVLVVALVAVTMQPTPAEALEPTTILLIAGAGVAVIALIAILIIANVTEKRPRTAQVVTSMVALPIGPFSNEATSTLAVVHVEERQNP